MSIAYGMQGFDNAESAIADARAEITVTDAIEFAVVRKGENYGWLFPLDYAERIAKSNSVEIVSVEKFTPPEVRMT